MHRKTSALALAMAMAMAMVLWLFIGTPVASWLAWYKAEEEIAALEAKAQRDETVSAAVLCSSVRQLELEAAARERVITAVGGIAMGFFFAIGAMLWQQRGTKSNRANSTEL